MRFRLIETLINEDIEAVKNLYPNMDDKDFYRTIKLDPTFNKERDSVGTYGKWLLNLFKKGKLNNEGHVADLLNRFEENKKYLKNKDINTFKSLEDVDSYLNDENNYNEKSHRQIVKGNQKARKNADISDDLVFEDDGWQVYIPSSYANSCKLGQGTNWCTASTESDYYYNYYKEDCGGDYYIIINKRDPEEKYQFHFESGQFMDAENTPLSFYDIINSDRRLKDFFVRRLPILKKIEVMSFKYRNVPPILISKAFGNSKTIDEFASVCGTSSEEILDYVLKGLNTDTFIVFADGVSDDIFDVCFNCDMVDDLGESIHSIDKIKILDGVTHVDADESFSHLGEINKIDFGNTVQELIGDWSDVLSGCNNIKLPPSVESVGYFAIGRPAMYSFNQNSHRNIALPSSVLTNNNLLDIIDPTTYQWTKGRKLDINIFIDNTEQVIEDNKEFLQDMNQDGDSMKIYPYEDYDKFVKGN